MLDLSPEELKEVEEGEKQSQEMGGEQTDPGLLQDVKSQMMQLQA